MKLHVQTSLWTCILMIFTATLASSLSTMFPPEEISSTLNVQTDDNPVSGTLTSDDDDFSSEITADEEEELLDFSLGGKRRLMSQPKSRVSAGCGIHNRNCRGRGSSGLVCCHYRCVDVRIDMFNCGTCGKRCVYPETCCRGKCVNIMFNRNHCGRCNNKCNKRVKCFYGMCGYA